MSQVKDFLSSVSHLSPTQKFIMKSIYIIYHLKALSIHLCSLQWINSNKAHTLDKHLLSSMPFKNSTTLYLMPQ